MNLLKPEEVSRLLNISKGALPALRRRETTFPQPIKLSTKVMRWEREQIEDWIRMKKEQPNGSNIRTG